MIEVIAKTIEVTVKILKAIGILIKIVAYMICAIVMLLKYSVEEIIFSTPIKRTGIISLYVGAIALFIFRRWWFWALLGVFILGLLLCVVLVIIDECIPGEEQGYRTDEEQRYHSDEERYYHSDDESFHHSDEGSYYNSRRGQTGGAAIPFFDGMTREAAKEEYRRLMKQYHPDNGQCGNLAMAQEIATAYSSYVARYGR